MRGVNIGYIKNLQINVNSVLILAYIKSSNIWIPKNSIVETNQTGLFNDTVIDIIPLEKIKISDIRSINLFNENCLTSAVFCNNQYIVGNRGLNYDDLVRATTRIAQRFDDPRFFSLLYIFLQNGIEISDDVVMVLNEISDIIYLFHISLRNFLLQHM
uniref:Mce/MlaD domain-containing protein n=1 Tax=Antithamnion hubbsii TaxID=1005974 RepID=A0A4D6WLK6_9FLOR|nr:hypothetical protein [Antithamnion hubbsii]